MIATAFGGYLVIGLAMAVFGPMKREISRHVSEARGTSFTNFLTDREQPSESKLAVFRVLVFLSLSYVLLWPVFICMVLGEKKAQRDIDRQVGDGIRFTSMGGGGTVQCAACDFSQRIASFTHGSTVDGEDCCTTGYQCLLCGRFVAIGNEEFSPFGTSTRCQCGGELSRSHVLFCPMCKSKELRYAMAYIT